MNDQENNAAPAAPAPTVPEGILDALRFYANGSHFTMHDSSAWDTVSGEPQNFYEDESNTATVEDGSVAKLALQGKFFPDAEYKEPVVEGEVFATATAPAAPASEPTDECDRCALPSQAHTGAHWCDNQSFRIAEAAPAAAGQAGGNQSEKIARQSVEEFKAAWHRVPYFADRVNKATREAIAVAVGNMMNLPALLDQAALQHQSGEVGADAMDAARYRVWRDAICNERWDVLDAMEQYLKDKDIDPPTPDLVDAAADVAFVAIREQQEKGGERG